MKEETKSSVWGWVKIVSSLVVTTYAAFAVLKTLTKDAGDKQE